MANNLTFTNGNMTLKNITEYPNSFKRQGAFPLERFSVFNTKAALDAYAKSNPVAYVGQILALVTEANNTTEVTVYSIQDSDGTVAEVGKATAGDQKSISLDADTGILSLNDFGVQYYAYNTETKSYNDVPTNGWKDGLVPVVHVDSTDSSKYSLIWKEPNPTTVEGLQNAIDTLDNRIDSLGTVMNLAEVLDETAFSALAGKVPTKWSDNSEPVAGDVVLVKITTATGDNLDKEYVVVSSTDGLKFELLGDPSGLTALAGRVSAIETGDYKNKLNEVKSADAQLEVSTTDKVSTLTVKKVNEALKADEATKVTNKLTFKETAAAETKIFEYDGSSAVIFSKDNHIASADKLGFIKSSTADVDAVKVDSKGVATVGKVSSAKAADKVANAITIFNKSYDGSVPEVTITKDDIGIASTTTIGLVKSTAITTESLDVVEVIQTGDDKGKMKVSKVTDAKNADNATKANEATKVTNKLTFGTTTFDGSAPKTITLSDLGFDGSDYATAAQGGKADTAVQGVTIAGKTATIDNDTKVASISATDLKAGLGLGTAAYQADTYFATATALASYVEDAVKKSNVEQTIAGTKTFTGEIIVPTPTNETHAANKAYVDNKVSTSIAAVDSMRFRGIIDGTTGKDALPTTDVRNGDTVKIAKINVVAIDGTKYDAENGKTSAKIGDMFIAVVTTGDSGTSIKWEYIPSADENDGNVSAANNLTVDQLVVGTGTKDVKTLAAGTNGNVLKIVDGKPAWSAESLTDVTSKAGTLERTKTGTVVNLEVAKVNVDKLEQTENTYIILNCGSSTVNI